MPNTPDIERVVLTAEGRGPNNITYFDSSEQPSTFASTNSASQPYFAKTVIDIEGVPTGGMFAIAQIEGKVEGDNEAVIFEVQDENGKIIELYMDYNLETNTYTATDVNGTEDNPNDDKVYFTLTWDADQNQLVMKQYALFKGIYSKDSIDIQFGFVDANGESLTTATDISFTSINNYVQYKFTTVMDGDTLDVSQNQENELILVKQGMESDGGNTTINTIKTGEGSDEVRIDAGKQEAAMHADGKNSTNEIRTGADTDSVIVTASAAGETAISATDKGTNEIYTGDGRDYIHIGGELYTADSGKIIIDASKGHDLVRLDASTFDDAQGLTVTGGKGNDILYLTEFSDSSKLPDTIKGFELIIFGKDKTILESTTNADMLKELNILTAENGKWIIPSDWKEITHAEMPTGYTAYENTDGLTFFIQSGQYQSTSADNVLEITETLSGYTISLGGGEDKITITDVKIGMQAKTEQNNTIDTDNEPGDGDRVIFKTSGTAMQSTGDGENNVYMGNEDDVFKIVFDDDDSVPFAMKSIDGGTNLIHMGKGDDFVHIEGKFSGTGNEINAGKGDDFVRLDASNIDFNDVLVEGGDDMDVLLASATNLKHIKEGVESDRITNFEVIVYGDEGKLADATSTEDVLKKLGLEENDNGKLEAKDDSHWTEKKNADAPTGYTAYTYDNPDDNLAEKMTILIKDGLY